MRGFWQRCAGLYEKLGGIAANSLIYRICLAVWRPIERVAGGGLIGRACRFVGMRGLLLICLAMYLPLDSAVRWVYGCRLSAVVCGVRVG